MKKISFSEKSIESLEAPDPTGKQKIYWDQDQVGFGILVSGKTTVKSIIVQATVDGKAVRVTLGTWDAYKAKSKRAKEELSQVEAELEEAKAQDDPVKKSRAHASKIKLLSQINPVEIARDEASLKRQDVRRGFNPKNHTDNMTLREALEGYCSTFPNLSERTREGYRKAINKFFPEWLDRKLTTITPNDILGRIQAIRNQVAANRQEMDESLQAKGQTPSDIFISPAGNSSANGSFRVLRTMWKYAACICPEIPKWDSENFKKKIPRVGSRERFISSDDLPKFFAEVNSKNAKGEYIIGRTSRDYILLSLFTGLRANDVLSLRWSQVELTAKIIRRSATETKGRKCLNLPMSDFVFDLLASRKARGLDGDYVFPGEKKGTHFKTPGRGLEHVWKRSGVRVNPHALRHTFLTISENCPISAIKKKALVGHAFQGDVTSSYTHIGVEDLREPAQLVTNKILEYAGVNIERKTLQVVR